ncbi:uncharacterized protein LOC128270206 [Anopheles cruzii]|uniref:uncharacterized protein LOC128270206 n=1 Tax=Anopheles cruzii TaxID=68878 RepID=UPI0022EC8833|nr:uncharacterized protein LOC128270206 [Anopheles cruzii]
MDLSESLKIPISKAHSSQPGNSASGSSSDQGAGYITEKLYMLLQLYLQNKGWSPSVELLQCFAELKDTPILPSAAYLQVLASRVGLDNQGRLVLRESGKIVLPYEHFANAVMLKHMSGPHGLHLSIEATVRAVMDSYTIGRENFGMEKEFIVEVVQSCPSPACRYYKGQIGVVPFIDQSFNPASHITSDYLSHLHQLGPNGGPIDISAADGVGKGIMSQMKLSKSASSPQHQSHVNAAIFQQQQNRSTTQKSFDSFANFSNVDKQRMMQLLDKQKHFDTVQSSHVGAQASHAQVLTGSSGANPIGAAVVNKQPQVVATANLLQQQQPQPLGLTQQPQPTAVVSSSVAQHHHHHQSQQQPKSHQHAGLQTVCNVQQQIISPMLGQSNTPGSSITSQHQQQQLSIQAHLNQPPLQTVNMDTGHKLSDYMRGAVDPHENITTSKELLALHSGAWNQDRDGIIISQDKIIRAFSELMRNISKMKTFIRPSMCKPYGKQSESLQKTLFDTIQLLQMLRNCLPAPHIPVSSWKGESNTLDNGNSETTMN